LNRKPNRQNRKWRQRKPKRAPRAKKTVVNPEATDAIDTPAPEAEPVAEAEPIAEAEPVVTVPLSKQDVIDQLKALIEQPGNDKKDRIDYLKQAFYRLHKVEHPDDAREEGEEPEAVAPEQRAPKRLKMTPGRRIQGLAEQLAGKRAEHNAEQEKQRAQNLEKKRQSLKISAC
jgi:hypothetical protein